jgi:hypothetical protein
MTQPPHLAVFDLVFFQKTGTGNSLYIYIQIPPAQTLMETKVKIKPTIELYS